ncbi:MAG: hypothetical protein GYA15_07275 [Leptolinea sp.]|jgi:hypothetical protein|nr:hypothetical protein [Leptolinea sp.]
MPATVKLTMALFLLIAVVWAGVGILYLAGGTGYIPSMQIKAAIGIVCLGCSLVTILVTFLLRRRNRLVYYTAVGLISMLLLGSFMDDLGWSDAVVIIVTMAALGLLIKDHAWYLGGRNTGNPVS